MRMKPSVKRIPYSPAYELLATGEDLVGGVLVKYKKSV